MSLLRKDIDTPPSLVLDLYKYLSARAADVERSYEYSETVSVFEGVLTALGWQLVVAPKSV